MAHTLAQRLRAAASSEQYDLANYTPSACIELVSAAFTEPIECAEIFRVTFVCGGGKLVRQKYYEDLPRDLAKALISIGYAEDRGAHAHISCAGSFKHQHDVDKNLLFVHVFPRVHLREQQSTDNDDQANSSISHIHMLLSSSLTDFQAMVTKQLKSLTQKRALLKALKETLALVSAAEAKLISMEALTPAEQSAFDNAPIEGASKLTYLTQQMELQCKNGPLSAAEQSDTLASLDTKIAQLESAPASAKQAAALQGARAQREATAALSPSAPTEPSRLSEYRQLQAQLDELIAIENAKGLQSLDVITKLKNKPAVQEQMRNIEKANRRWLETDADFDARWKAALAVRVPKQHSTSSKLSAVTLKKPAAAKHSNNSFAALGDA